MSDWSEGTMGNVASGAAAGSAFGPWGAVIGAGLGLVGGMLGNSAQSELADNANRQQWEMFTANAQFQREMAQNAYQYRVQDLKKAGLNPMLAINAGGASASGGTGIPSPVVAQYRNLGEAAASGAAAVRANDMNAAQIDLLRAQTATAATQANYNSAKAAQSNAETLNTVADNPRIAAVARAQAGDYGAEEMQRKAFFKISNEIDLTAEQKNYLTKQIQRGGVLDAQAASLFSNAQLNTILKALRDTELPGAKNRQASDETKFGREWRPYLPDIGQIVNGAGAIMRMGR